MTKRLLAEMIRQHTAQMSLDFSRGQISESLNFQSIAARTPATRPREQRQQEARDKLLAVCDQYAERHGGDSWSSRRADGEWTRLHVTPCRSLFTSCRVAQGPAHPDWMGTRRVTEGVDIEGNKLRVDDDWKEPGRAHRVLNLPWTGLTTFWTRNVVWHEGKVEGSVDTELPLGVLQGGEVKSVIFWYRPARGVGGARSPPV